MAYLKYYADENQRHKDVVNRELSFSLCREMAMALFGFFQVPMIPVEIIDRTKKRFQRVRRVRSWYQPRNAIRGLERHIVLHPSMLNPLTVAHEVAHYIHDIDKTRRREEHKLQDAKRGTYTRLPKEKWHGRHHRIYTDRGVAFLKQKYAERLAPVVSHTVKVDTASGTMQADLVAKFFAELPEWLHCPKCGFHQTKGNFGVRVMKRDAQGKPIVLRRQSYCKGCR